MGMFERLGEKVERFKQEAVAARDDSAEYRCRDCETEFYSERQTCPACGSAEIEGRPAATASDEETDAKPDANADGETDTRSETETETDTE